MLRAGRRGDPIEGREGERSEGGGREPLISPLQRNWRPAPSLSFTSSRCQLIPPTKHFSCTGAGSRARSSAIGWSLTSRSRSSSDMMISGEVGAAGDMEVFGSRTEFVRQDCR